MTMNDIQDGVPALVEPRTKASDAESAAEKGAAYLDGLAVKAIDLHKGTFQKYRDALQAALELEQKDLQGKGGMDATRRVHEYEISVAKLDNEQALFNRDEQVASLRRYEDRLDRAQQTRLIEQQATVLKSQAAAMEHANTIQEGSAAKQAEFLDRQTKLMAETNRIYTGIKWLTVVVAFAAVVQAVFAGMQYAK
jgi:hypothetical protein